MLNSIAVDVFYEKMQSYARIAHFMLYTKSVSYEGAVCTPLIKFETTKNCNDLVYNYKL